MQGVSRLALHQKGWCVTIAVVALAVLSAALSPPVFAATGAEGGSTQVAAQSGCVNQWMFNGVWRMRVTKVAFRPAGDKPNGWDVSMQWANGTSFAGISPVDTMKQDLVLALANGDTLTATDTTTGSLNQQQLDFHTFPASGQFTYTQMFLTNQTLDQNNAPAKLLVTFDVPKYRSAHPGAEARFWRQKSPGGYNYRIDLTCTR